MTVAIIGQGYVGLTLSIGALSAGHKVIGFDPDALLIQELKAGKTKVPNIDFQILRNSIRNNSFIPTTDSKHIADCEIIIIAVPTPLDIDRNPYLVHLEDAASKIATNVRNKALIINESTSYPGTLRNLIKPICESLSKFEFEYASAPERIDPANPFWKLDNTPRLVSGLTKTATKKALDFYKTFCSEVYEVSQPEVAEAAKLFENTFRQINIALANEFSIIANAIGFSAHEAIKAASTKPFGFMPFYPSVGVGGHCIPVDPSYLSYAANQVGISAQFIELANTTNLNMSRLIVSRIKKEFNGDLIGMRIQLAGISYKPEVSDMRESPGIILMNILKESGADVNWHDPVVINFNGETSVPLDSSVDLGLIVTPHKVIDFSAWKSNGTKVLDISANAVDYGWPKYL